MNKNLSIDEIAKILCSPKSNFKEDVDQQFLKMMKNGLTQAETIQLIKYFYHKSNMITDVWVQDNVFNLYNLQSLSPVTSILLSCLLAINDVAIMNYLSEINGMQVLNKYCLKNDLQEAIGMVKKYKICFVDSNALHPCLLNIEEKTDFKNILLRSLISIAVVDKCILMIQNKKMFNLVITICKELKLNQFMVVNKSTENNILTVHISKYESEQTLVVNAKDYGLKLASKNIIDSEESGSIIKAISLGYNADYKDEIILLTSITLFFADRVMNLQEGIDVAVTSLTGDKLLNLTNKTNII